MGKCQFLGISWLQGQKKRMELALGSLVCVMGNTELPLERQRVPRVVQALLGSHKLTWQFTWTSIFCLSSFVYLSVY